MFTVALVLAPVVARTQVVHDSSLAIRSWSAVERHPVLTGSILAGSAALLALDGSVSRGLVRARAGSGEELRDFSIVTSSVGGYAPLTLGASLFAAGSLTHHPFVAHLGRDVTTSVLESGAVTALLKGAVGRARPETAPGDADEYMPGRGFFDAGRASFPSGHTSAAFAAATVLATELSHVRPRQAKWIRFATYGAATLVGVSRMYENAHWASDVAAGAALGVASGLHVVRGHSGAH